MDAMLIPTFLCPKAWEGMSGNETSRFCSYCKKNVHNLNAMSVNERLALLASPAARICSRYKVAIRRPAKGKEESYLRHLIKYGAGVALTGSVLLVLWEMQDEQAMRTFYRTAAGLPGMDRLIPADLYEESHCLILGEMVVTPPPPPTLTKPANDRSLPQHVDLDLDPIEINRLMEAAKSRRPELPPAVSLKSK
jgi:hypothetical protein